MNPLTDEQWARELFSPLKALADQNIPPSNCLSPPRIWRLAGGLSECDDRERQHLEDCPRCRDRLQQFRETIARCPAPGTTTAKPPAEAEWFDTEPATIRQDARSADRVAEPTVPFHAVPAIALENGQRPQPPLATAQRWQLVARRGQATVDTLPGSGSDDQTEVVVLRRDDAVVQIGLDGFLLPQSGEQVLVEVRGADGEMLGSNRLPDGDDVADLRDLRRPIQDGDRLRITRRGLSPEEKLEIELQIRPT